MGTFSVQELMAFKSFVDILTELLLLFYLHNTYSIACGTIMLC